MYYLLFSIVWVLTVLLRQCGHWMQRDRLTVVYQCGHR